MAAKIRDLLDEIARKQLGLISRTQALETGLTLDGLKHRLSTGELHSVRRRVYRLRGAPDETVYQRLLAVCLSLGPGTVASHSSAAWLWALDGYRDAPTKLEVTTPMGTSVKLKGVIVHRRRTPTPEGFAYRGRVPVTLLVRTMLDLTPTLDDLKLETALDSAARYRHGFFDHLAEFLATLKGRGHDGLNRLDALNALRRGYEPTGSILETKVLRELRRAGIETPINQYPIFKYPDRPLCHADFAWPRLKIALFCDSNYHLGKRARLDAWQRLELQKLGWKPIVVFDKSLDDRRWIASFAELFHPAWPSPEKPSSPS